MKPEPVGISNEAFFIANVMMDCPARTVIRELLQNAIEASGRGRIQFFVFEHNGVRKLGLYNEGAGMTERELRERMRIANSSKELAFDKNFGQGAKMSAGKASPHGLIYRSCTTAEDGHRAVYEVWLQVQDRPNGGKVLVMMPQWDDYQDEEAIVRQVTDDAVTRGRSLDCDWTEAILLGRSHDDDTASGDFLSPDERERSVLWLMRAINQRYYRFPMGVVIRDATVPSPRETNHRNARGMWAVLKGAPTEHYEEVATSHARLGVVAIVYGKLSGTAQSRRGGPLGADGLPGGSHVCLVYKNEIYNFDPRWYYSAGAYGFSTVCEDYYVHIRLSDNAPVRNNNHRTEIVYDDREAEAIVCEDLCQMVRDNRPQWVLDDIAARTQSETYGRVQERLRNLAMKMKAKMDTCVVSPDDGADSGVLELERNQVKNESGDGEREPSGRDARERVRSTQRALGRRQERPRPETLQAVFRSKERFPSWYDDLAGRAGAYDKADNTIWLSTDFSEYQRLREWVERCWPAAEENGIADTILRDEYCFFAGCFGVGALAFRGNPLWTPDQWEKCLTSEALSAHMCDPAGAIEAAIRREVGKRLNLGIRRRFTEEAYA